MAEALIRLFGEHVSAVHSTTRISTKALSIKTQERRTSAICRAFVELREGGFALASPWNLRSKHVAWLVSKWVGEGQSGGTIENKLTYLRALADWMSKTGVVGTLGDYVDRREHGLVRSYVAEADRSWAANGVNATEKIEEIAQTCPRVAVQLKLQAAFGLRLEESFMLQRCVQSGIQGFWRSHGERREGGHATFRSMRRWRCSKRPRASAIRLRVRPYPRTAR